jgi:hypothetical protein
VEFIKPMITKAEAKAAGQAIKLAGQAIKLAHAEAVAKAEVITEAEAEALGSMTEALTPAQLLQLEKFYLERFYRTAVDADLVMLDKGGRTQQEIKSLERLLNPQLATDRTAGTINRNADSPQDWSKAAVRSWLYESSGFADYARRIVAGEVTDISKEMTAPIAEFVRTHNNEFRIAFGFNKLDEISDRQIVGEMLRANIIRTKRHRRSGNYSVDVAALAAVLAIIERRKQADPPPLIIGVDQGGGSHQNTQQIETSPTEIETIEYIYTDPAPGFDVYGYPIDDFAA